ncbi:chemotaxis protein CheW [Entomospira nematocerorum]|uniref:Chemotaxis protein CheW n=1 Tax=Entomospira nematocerorum TaxID=2719987 RepID=A0A968KXU6_9SPIO|nr:chemotaxis protein CheW [Entomospira nematocera]NIZ46877.1 hypothetical protein [Entomospira nematocera]WDI33324.1 chemotaxis protein CheW [Entomospira nematocera]
MTEIEKEVIDLPNRESTALEDYKAVSFTLAGKDYGVDIMSVREISRGGRFTYVPNTPHFVRGVYNLRGEIIPVVDLRDFFGLPVNKEERVEGILICRVKDTTLGLVVDSIEKVIGINRRNIQPAHPMFAEINIQYIEGIIDREERLYVLLNIHQIFGIAKELIEEEESQVTQDAQPVPTTDTSEQVAQPIPSAPVEAATPRSSPPPQHVHNHQPPVQQPVATQPFVAPSPNISQPSTTTDAQSQALLDMLNAMPEPEADILSQPDIESLLSDTPLARRTAVFEGDPSLLNNLGHQLQEWIGFKINNLNRNWIIEQANTALKNGQSLYLEDEKEALNFISSFFSEATDKIWSQEMMQELADHLTPRDKGIFHVWNPGTHMGYEAYSLLGLLLTKGITNTPKIYAQDIDLIAVSGAPHLSFSAQELPEEFDLLTIQGGQGLQFKNEYKNCIIFEFADITSRNTFPGLDLIVARDTLSYLTDDEIEKFLDDADEMSTIGTLMVLGDNEALYHDTWKLIGAKHLSIYKKIK